MKNRGRTGGGFSTKGNIGSKNMGRDRWKGFDQSFVIGIRQIGMGAQGRPKLGRFSGEVSTLL